MKIGAAILESEKESLIKRIEEVKNVDFVQIDVMDGAFTPGKKTVWLDAVREGIKKSKFPVELHLMISNPDTLIDNFLELKADTYIFHYEATQKPEEIIAKVKKAKKKVGIALKLQTSATVLRNILDKVDMVLIYCTEKIGEQGPAFNILATKNIHIIREYNRKIPIEVDGGIKPHTARLAKLAGATQAVSGSYLISNNYSDEAISKLREV